MLRKHEGDQRFPNTCRSRSIGAVKVFLVSIDVFSLSKIQRITLESVNVDDWRKLHGC